MSVALLGAGLILLNSWFYRRQRDQALARTADMLGQLAEVKARELDALLSAFRRSAVIMTLDEPISHDLSIAILTGRALTTVERQRAVSRMDVWQRQHGLVAVELLDMRLQPLGSTGTAIGGRRDAATLRTEVDRSAEPVFSEAARESTLGDSVVFRVLAPMPGDDNARGRTIGYVLFTVNASREIFQRLSWGDLRNGPEYLLVRREGDQVHFLSDLGSGNVPEEYRMPLATEHLAAASAFRGETAMFDAVDPRGVNVVARAHAVPGTAWILIAEMDRGVALAPLREAEWTTAVLFLILALGMTVLVRGTLGRIEAEARVEEADAKLNLEVSRQRYDFLSRHAQDVILVLDESGRIVDVNERCLAMYGIPRASLIGRAAADLRSDASRRAFNEEFARVAVSDGVTFECEHRRADGTVFPVEISARRIDQGGHHLFHEIVRDISDRREAQRRQELAASIFSASTEAMMITDAANRILEVNPAFVRITGYTAADVAGKSPQLLASGRHPADFYRQMWQEIVGTGHWEGEIWNRRKSGEILAEWLVVSAVRDDHGNVVNYIAQFSDVTEEKRSNEITWKQANYDNLTQLPNRRLFRDRLEQEIKKAKRAHRAVAVLFIDLDRFKEVNDTLGHVAGDRVLVQVARRIVRTVRDSDTVARLGGDEFTIVLADIEESVRAERVAENLVKTLAQPYLIDEDRVYLSASIGITMYPRDTATAETLLQNADQAMYLAKREGRGRFSVYTEALQESSQRHRRLAADLTKALAKEEFVLQFQPVVDLRTGGIVQAEALIRWQHPALGTLAPADFISVAEETGQISDIGDWVIHTALRAAQRFSTRVGHSFRVGVNISPVQLQHHERRLDWLAAMRRDGISGEHLLIEITEGALLADRPDIEETLAASRAAGVEVALDDFGTGYSSLSHLNTFRPDYLKIDRSFTHNITAPGRDLVLAEGIIVMAHTFGVRVIAEGIETPEERELLTRAGCDFGQGFLFSRPLSEERFTRLLPKGKRLHG